MAHDVLKVQVELKLIPQALHLALQPVQLHGLFYYQCELFVIDGFDQVIIGPFLHRCHRRMNRSEGREHNKWHGRVHRFSLAQQLQPVHPRHFQIRDHQVEPFRLKFVQRLFAGGGTLHLVALLLQDPFKERHEILFVIHYEDALTRLAHRCLPPSTENEDRRWCRFPTCSPR